MPKAEVEQTAETSLTLRARGVTKHFGAFEALRGMDLDIRRAECVGLLGPNGAGKSTFIGCLYGAVQRSGGTLEVFGLDPAHSARRIKEKLGVVPQENALDEELTVVENMRLYARFAGLNKAQAVPRIEELLHEMALGQKRNAQIKMLSGGMKRRLAFVRALLADPELLILDEPTTGLDPTVRHLIWEKVHGFRQAGKTVLVTTHYMHEAESLCDRVVILARGVVVDAGAPRTLIDERVPGFVAFFPAEAEPTLRPLLNGMLDAYTQGRQFCTRAKSLGELTDLQARSGLRAIQMRPTNLEDVYLKLTGHGLSDDE